MKPLRRLPLLSRSARRGVTLIEALVALVIMSFGMVALVGLLSNLRYSADLSRQRGEAMRLAQADLEKLRAFSLLRRAAGATTPPDFDTDVASSSRSISDTSLNATFTLQRTVSELPVSATLDTTQSAGRSVQVKVSWTDRGGRGQYVTMHTVIARADPAFSAALGIAPPADGIRTPDGRNPVIPPGATDLGNGKSGFRPGGAGAPLWVFNNRTGVIVGKCSVPPETLSASAVDSCTNPTVGYLLSGTIRFSMANAPDPSAPEAMARPVSIYAALTASLFKRGGSDVPGGLYSDYPTPNQDCFTDSPTSLPSTQPMVNYYCIIYPNTQTPPNWWGTVYVTGLTLGSSASQFKVCRYSADYNGNGYVSRAFRNVENFTDPADPIDNEEHPETYRHVSYSLAKQNFLVVRGDVSCPLLPADPSANRYFDFSTQEMPPPPAR